MILQIFSWIFPIFTHFSEHIKTQYEMMQMAQIQQDELNTPNIGQFFDENHINPEISLYPEAMRKYLADEYGNMPIMNYSEPFSFLVIVDKHGERITKIRDISKGATAYLSSENRERKIFTSTHCNMDFCEFSHIPENLLQPIINPFDNAVKTRFGQVKSWAIQDEVIGKNSLKILWSKNKNHTIPLIYGQDPCGMSGDCTSEEFIREIENLRNNNINNH